MLLWFANLGWAAGGTPRHDLNDPLGGGDGKPAVSPGIVDPYHKQRLEEDEIMLHLIMESVTREIIA
jgi:hypothetical protein